MSRHSLRRLVRAFTRVLPSGLLVVFAMASIRPIAVVGRAGLQNRPVRIRTGAATGLVIDVGWGETDPILGRYEPQVQRALAALVQPGDVVYDVGAHSGFVSLLAGRSTGGRGAVYAFEPDATNADLTRRNMRRNRFDHVTVVQEAVGSRTGTALLRRSSVPARHSIVERRSIDADADIVEIPIVALDDFAARPGVRPPDLVKVDVEGFEDDVVAGMTTLLQTVAPVLLIEFDGVDRRAALQRSAGVRQTLSTLGYEVTELAESYESHDFAVVHLVGRPLDHRSSTRYLPGARLATGVD